MTLPPACSCCLQPQTAAQASNATLTVTGAVGWRREGIKYKKNEVYLDVVEEVNMIMSSAGWPTGVGEGQPGVLDV